MHVIKDLEMISLRRAQEVKDSRCADAELRAQAESIIEVGGEIWKLSDTMFEPCFKLGYDALVNYYFAGLPKRKRAADLKIGTLYNARLDKRKKSQT